MKRGLFSLAVLLFTTACATNPVTGKHQLNFMSEEQEIRMGREMDAQVQREMGVYEDRDLQQYIEDVGMNGVRASDPTQGRRGWQRPLPESSTLPSLADRKSHR